MKSFLAGIFVVFFTIQMSGCASKEESISESQAEQSIQTATPVSSGKKVLDLAQTGILSGKVSFGGEVPAPKTISVKGNPECSLLHEGGSVQSEELLVKDGGVQNAFVYLKQGLEAYEFSAPKEPAVVSNLKCVYVPHVLGVQVGQPVEYLNSDSTLHNVHAFPKINKGFNLGLPFANMKQTKAFTQEEITVPLKCDVHPWMLGYIGVLKHPYFAVTDAEGNFEMKNIPAGDYTIEVWHEKLGVQSQTVKIEPQQIEIIEFKFDSV